jgi:hypothetical protein
VQRPNQNRGFGILLRRRRIARFDSNRRWITNDISMSGILQADISLPCGRLIGRSSTKTGQFAGFEIAQLPGMSVGRLVFTVFIVLQVSDGLITYAAISVFGSGAEGNPLIQTWIHLIGAGPALFAAKLLACACGGVLYTLGVRKTLAALTGLYFLAAVGPWLHILSR